MKQSFAPSFPTGLSYFVADWTHGHSEEPVKFWYEISQEGECLREISINRDGRLIADAVANYPGGITKFGFGTLHGASFWESEWNAEPDAYGDATRIRAVIKAEFEDVWKIAQS